MANGHGGIQTIIKSSTSGLVDTYTITYADTTTSTFTVTNGRSISNITTSKSGKVTTITIHYNDSTTSNVTVRDGENVTAITEYWAVSTSGSSQPQSGWQTTPPSLTATYKYLWHYTRYTYSDGTNTSTPPAVQGVYGDKGDTGATGTSITSIAKTGTSGLVDTYTVTMSDGTTTTFTVTNGSEIESIVKTGTAGLVDTYTVTMGNGETHTFTVTNGRSIVSFTQTSGTHAAGTIDVYTITYNDGDTSQIQVYNGANGTGAVSSVAGIGVSGPAGDVPLIIQDYGAPTTATVGQVNQLYFDKTGGIMYICISTTGGTYDWRGMSSAVDSAMSTTSANPLQNRVISNKVGVGSLASTFTATNLTDAANELQTNKVPDTRTVNSKRLNANITLNASDIPNDSTVNGTNVDDALDNLKGAINVLQGEKSVRYDTAQTLTAAQKIQVFTNIFGANNNAGFHNSFFRGKSLGTSFTTAQHSAIAAGTFDDMFIGDYWTIGGIDYVICHFDYYYQCSDANIDYHHIVLMPRGVMTGLSVTKTSAETSDGYYQWNETNTTAGGYIASRMRTVIMPACDTKVKAAFGSSYVKTISEIYPNGQDASTGRATGWAWTATDLACDLLNETMIYGAQVWSISNDGRPGYEVGIDKWQLAIFRLYPAFANIRAYWWLRSVASATYAAFVTYIGYASSGGTSYAYGVRPRFLVS